MYSLCILECKKAISMIIQSMNTCWMNTVLMCCMCSDNAQKLCLMKNIEFLNQNKYNNITPIKMIVLTIISALRKEDGMIDYINESLPVNEVIEKLHYIDPVSFYFNVKYIDNTGEFGEHYFIKLMKSLHISVLHLNSNTCKDLTILYTNIEYQCIYDKKSKQYRKYYEQDTLHDFSMYLNSSKQLKYDVIMISDDFPDSQNIETKLKTDVTHNQNTILIDEVYYKLDSIMVTEKITPTKYHQYCILQYNKKHYIYNAYHNNKLFKKCKSMHNKNRNAILNTRIYIMV